VHAHVTMRILLSSSVSFCQFETTCLLPSGRRPFRLPHIIHEHADVHLAPRPTRIVNVNRGRLQRVPVT
jgi:hypothetical protein